MRRAPAWALRATLVVVSLIVMAPAAAASCVGSPAPYDVTLLGDGTTASPYLIDTPLKLSAVASGTCSTSAAYALAADLQMPTATTSGGITSNFRRITSSSPGGFDGTFDGAGYTIRGLTYRDATNGTIGLFASLTTGAVVRNADLDQIDFEGQYSVGGIAGEIESGANGVVIEGAILTGEVRGETDIGGIVGLADPTTGNATVLDALTLVDVTSTAPSTDNANAGGAIGRVAVQAGGSVHLESVRRC